MPKFKLGDKIQVVSHSVVYGTSPLVGEILTITQVGEKLQSDMIGKKNGDRFYRANATPENPNSYWTLFESELELAEGKDD